MRRQFLTPLALLLAFVGGSAAQRLPPSAWGRQSLMPSLRRRGSITVRLGFTQADYKALSPQTGGGWFGFGGGGGGSAQRLASGTGGRA